MKMNKVINYFFEEDEKELIEKYLVLIPLFVVWLMTIFMQEERMKRRQKEKRTKQPSKSSLCQNDDYIITQSRQKSKLRCKYGWF